MKNLNYLAMGLAVIGTSVGASPYARADAMQVNPALSARPGAPASGMASRGAGLINIRIRNSCFGTNLRHVSNPLSPNAKINASFTLKLGAKEETLKLFYPSGIVTEEGVDPSTVKPMNPSTYTLPEGATAGIYGNTILIRLKNIYNINLESDVVTDGDGVSTSSQVNLKSAAFVQSEVDCAGGQGLLYNQVGLQGAETSHTCGKYKGANGALSYKLAGMSVSNDKQVIELTVSFPGQDGFCGGYFSPLMLFFSNARPKFDGTVAFSLEGTLKSHWPAAGKNHALLALDRDGDGKISDRKELFGDQETMVNGFETLKTFDDNADGKIDSRDEVYGRLLLWFDDGDGVSAPTELVSLKSRVKEIGLRYKEVIRQLGNHAEERQQADFVTIDGKKRKVVDVWFRPAP